MTSTDPHRGRVRDLVAGDGAERGLRLRYEIRSEFAPYVGMSWTWLGGRTADCARADGRETARAAVVARVRIRF